MNKSRLKRSNKTKAPYISGTPIKIPKPKLPKNGFSPIT
jgi:hypothetical protein